MWYFSWILGLTAAILLAVMNAMWYGRKDKTTSERLLERTQRGLAVLKLRLDLEALTRS